MTKDVFITISGLQLQEDEESQKVEVISVGEYYLKNNKHYIKYDEVMEGFQGTTKNLIKLQPDLVEITKKGVTNVHMVFEVNKKNIASYDTPMGSIMVGIEATSIQIKEEEDSILVEVLYALELNYEHLADCTINLKVQEKGNKNFKLCS